MKQWLVQKGISLLEMVLVIAISASVILVGLRYYSQARQQYRVAATLKQLDRIVVASNHWQRGHRDGESVTMDQLVASGLLIKEDSNNQWGGTVLLAENEQHHVMVTMTQLPTHACQALASTWPSEDRSQTSHCQDNGDWEGELA